MQSILAKTGWTLLLFFSFVPVVIWYLMPNTAYRYASVEMVTTSLGQVTGLVGLVMFALSLFLSMRHRWFEPFFGGMNNVYIAHHQLGGIAFFLLLLHPLFLVYSYAKTSFAAGFLFLFPGEDWTVNVGIAALLLLMSLLIITYWADLPYQLWRFTHKFLGIALVLGAVHGMMVSSDVSRTPLLWWYMVGICGLGVIGFVYRSVLGRFLVPRYAYTLQKIVSLGSGIVELHLVPESEHWIHFVPGQFLFITFGSRGGFETHPFSISSAPADSGIRLTVKALDDFTNKLDRYKEHSTVYLEGPYGKFSPVYHPSKSYIWIGGGIGITPFISMARALVGQTISIDLYYAVRDESEAVYMNELITLAKDNPLFKIILWTSKTNGRLTGKSVTTYSPDYQSRDIFFCGPPPMMHGLKKQLRELGVNPTRLISEEFSMLD